jgi:hypothetical protein
MELYAGFHKRKITIITIYYCAATDGEVRSKKKAPAACGDLPSYISRPKLYGVLAAFYKRGPLSRYLREWRVQAALWRFFHNNLL